MTLALVPDPARASWRARRGPASETLDAPKAVHEIEAVYAEVVGR